MSAENISMFNLAVAYLLLIFPLGLMLWYGIPGVGKMLLAALRMTLQLLFVGFYLQVVFNLNNGWLTGLWLLIMIIVADLSIIRNCRLKLKRLGASMFIALLLGTAIPAFFFLGIILHLPKILEAQYAIPIVGMILGNCMRSDIIGINSFYRMLRKDEKSYLLSLAQGATLSEACRPYLRDAFQAALAPMTATMSTVGLVALPGMMTGVILAGADPVTAIKYQIAIMLAIFSGTAITVFAAIRLSMRSSFTGYGILDRGVFRE